MLKNHPIKLITDDDYNSIVHKIALTINRNHKIKINYLNTHGFNTYFVDQVYRDSLIASDILFPDGIGIWLGGKFLEKKNIQRFNWTDYSNQFLNLCSEKKWRLFFLGSTKEILDCAITQLRTKYPTIQIVGWADGYGDLAKESLLSVINNSKADILWVGLGTPKQEKWIYKKSKFLDVKVINAVGDIYSYLADKRSRGPVFLRQLGFEWLFRVALHPKRYWKRYLLGIPTFVFRLIKMKLTKQS